MMQKEEKRAYFEANGRLTKEGLELAGRALFGERWKSPLANALGIGSSRIREVMRGARRALPDWTRKIEVLLKAHSEDCLKALRDLKDSQNDPI